MFNILYDTRKATGLSPNEVENLDWDTGWEYYKRYTLEKIFES